MGPGTHFLAATYSGGRLGHQPDGGRTRHYLFVALPNSLTERIIAFLFQVHGSGEGGGEAAVPPAHLHLVLGLPAAVLKVQDPDQDHIQDRGENTSSTT